MRLSVAIPKSDNCGTFELQEIAEGSSDKYLKEKGFEYAESAGEEREGLRWEGNLVMGDKPIDPVKKWTMHLTDGSILVIE